MRISITPNTVKLWASARDTSEWANRPGARWPCSYLAGRRFFAEFDANGLLDMTIDGGRGAQDLPVEEFTACSADLLRGRVPGFHPAYFVAVGQFSAA